MTPHQERIARAAFEAWYGGVREQAFLDDIWNHWGFGDRTTWLRVAQAAIRAHETELPDQCHFAPDDGAPLQES